MIAALCLLIFAGGCSAVRSGPPEKEFRIKEINIEETWGIRIEGARLSAGGYMIDFRYRVVDPDKAQIITGPANSPVLLDEASGARFQVPVAPKAGPLRQVSANGKPEAGRTYFILFANPGRYVKQGNKVTVEIGKFRAEGLILE